MAVHLGVGAVLGTAFGILTGALRVPRLVGLPFGLGYGFVVLLVMSYVVLPVAAELFDGGKPISDMAEMVGWGTFTLEHLVFGMVLGLWPLLRPTPADLPRGATASLALDK